MVEGGALKCLNAVLVTVLRGARVAQDANQVGIVFHYPLREDRNSINKYEIVRTVLERLNTKGESSWLCPSLCEPCVGML